MASVYILYSKKLERFYVGSCKDLDYRIDQHLNKDFKASFTSKAEDWEVFFFIDDLQYAQARKIEKHIKSMKSKKYIQNLLKYPELTQNLVNQYS
jgi:putative endonuclease